MIHTKKPYIGPNNYKITKQNVRERINLDREPINTTKPLQFTTVVKNL